MACAESSLVNCASKETKGHNAQWGDIGDEAAQRYATRQDTETRCSCGVVGETLVLLGDDGIIYSAALAGSEED